jgi:hypothetical protein
VKALDLRRTANTQHMKLTMLVGLDFIGLIRRLGPHKKVSAPIVGPRAVKEFKCSKTLWRKHEVGLEVTSYLPAEIDVI